MDEIFRPCKAILYRAIVCSLFFLAVIGGYSSLFFLENPQQYGFRGEHAAVRMGAMGLVLFGFFLLLSLYMLAAYFFERFSICGTTLTLQTVLRNHQFDVSDLDRMMWKRYGGGRIVFHRGSEKSCLDISEYSVEDRLRVISILRDLVPHDRQEGWPEFCHHVALRLRDFVESPIQRELMPAQLRITRSRYDRMAMIVVPSTVVLAVAVGLGTGRWQFLALPALLIGFWVLLRSATPKTGLVDRELTAEPSGRAFIIYVTIVFLSLLFGAILRLRGVEESIVTAILLVCVIVPGVPAVYLRLKEDRQQRYADEAGIKTAPDRWLRASTETSDGA